MNCRLCNSASSKKLFSDDFRSYWHCEKCGLIFVPAREHAGVQEEKKRYTLHHNSSLHEGYVRFLNEIVMTVCAQCRPSDRILDYGSGQRAVLAGLLQDRGYDCAAYDPLYGIGTGALTKSYNAIILCEVIEHVRDLKRETMALKKTLNRKGLFVVRTQLYAGLEDFSGWWYKNDITHINFFGRATIDTLARMLGREKSRQAHTAEDIFILRGR